MLQLTGVLNYAKANVRAPKPGIGLQTTHKQIGKASSPPMEKTLPQFQLCSFASEISLHWPQSGSIARARRSRERREDWQTLLSYRRRGFGIRHDTLSRGSAPQIASALWNELSGAVGILFRDGVGKKANLNDGTHTLYPLHIPL